MPGMVVGMTSIGTADQPRAQLAEQIRDQVLTDDWFATVAAQLAQLAAWRTTSTSGSLPDVDTDTLRVLNRITRAEQDTAAVDAALTTGEVIEHIEPLHDRRGVAARVQRGKLLAFKTGRRTRYPSWQIQPDQGDTIPDIDRWVDACHTLFAGDVIAMDLAVRAPRADLDGRSIAELLADGRWAAAYAALTTPLDQAG